MTNDELMTKHESLLLRNAMASGALQFVIRISFVIRHSDFVIFDLAFHIPNRRESDHRFADSRQLRCRDHFVDVFVRSTGFLCEARP